MTWKKCFPYGPVLTAGVLGALWLAAMSPATASAQPAPDSPSSDKPWYAGVSPEQQQRARELFREGVALHKQVLYARAAAKYREALAHWQHPDISFNLSRALIKLERPIEAYQSLLEAMRYGPISLPPEVYEQAEEYKQLLRGQLAEIEVQCDEPGAEVTVNGAPLFTGPGTQTKLVLPGPLLIVASKDGHVDDTQKLQILPGERKQAILRPVITGGISIAEVSCSEPDAEITMDGAPLMRCPGRVSQALTPNKQYTFVITRPGRITEQKQIKLAPGQTAALALNTTSVGPEIALTRRWDRWKPWVVVGLGAAATVVGSVYEVRAIATMAEYDEAVDEACPRGCQDNDAKLDKANQLRSSARQQNRIGLGMLVASGVTIAAGIGLVLLNQPRKIVLEQPTPGAVTVLPLVAPDRVGAGRQFSC